MLLFVMSELLMTLRSVVTAIKLELSMELLTTTLDVMFDLSISLELITEAVILDWVSVDAEIFEPMIDEFSADERLMFELFTLESKTVLFAMVELEMVSPTKEELWIDELRIVDLLIYDALMTSSRIVLLSIVDVSMVLLSTVELVTLLDVDASDTRYPVKPGMLAVMNPPD